MRILLVDDEENVLKGVSRMIELEMDEWEIETAGSGQEALSLLADEPFNVIVADTKIAGADSEDLLARVASEHPGVMRIVLSGEVDRDSVFKAVRPMHQYLSKPCDPQALIDIIRRAEIFQQTIHCPDVLGALGNANCMPSLPALVQEISQELTSDRCTAKSIAKILTQDPLLCARVLQLANSAIFALRQPVVDINHGVAIVGSDLIRTLVLAQKLFPGDNAHRKAMSATRLFEHCFNVGVVGRELAASQSLSNEQLNAIFSGGLLHDVGKMILLNAFPDSYTKLLAENELTGTPIWKLELDEFGAAHQGVGAYLLELWGVPPLLIETVAAHHSFAICATSPLPCQLVYAANWIVGGADRSVIEAELAACDHAKTGLRFATKLRRWNEYLIEKDGVETKRNEKPKRNEKQGAVA